MWPSSMITWSTPTPRNAAALSGWRVVDSTVMPRCVASTAVAIPIEEVLPRIRIDWPDWASSPMVSDPWALCSIPGTAPRVDQSRSLAKVVTCGAGTQVYSA
jgi:hypothetical protein